MNKVLTGLDVLREEYWEKLKGYNLGLLSNQASLDCYLTPAKYVIAQKLPGKIKVLFGPQHGHGGEDQDNMIETDHSYEDELNIPIFSLYNQGRMPDPEMLRMIDILIIDLQDVGTRVYTFASTMLNCLRMAAKIGKKIIILDRPNPLGGVSIEGNLLEEEFFSFVGPYTLPMKHALTMGEMAIIFNKRLGIEAEMEIVPLKGWTREMNWTQTGLRWVMPSPNMPFYETARVYPGQVIWEGTNISEGRGTCRPFEIFGAPFIHTKAIREALKPLMFQGCSLQDYLFRPTFNKWHGQLCKGFMIHVVDNKKYNAYLTSLSLLKAIMEIHSDQFQWKEPPYEYEYEKKPIDVILGTQEIRKELRSGKDILAIRNNWLGHLKAYKAWRKPFLLYD